MSDDRNIALLEEMNQHLAIIVKVMAQTNIAGLTQREAVERLASWGLNAKTISSITGYGVASVAPIMSRSKKQPTSKAKSARQSARVQA